MNKFEKSQFLTTFHFFQAQQGDSIRIGQFD